MSIAPTAAPSASTPSTTRAVDYDQWFERPWGRYAFAVESAAILHATGVVAGARVLDAGCGTGRFSAPLTRARATPIGVDHNLGMLTVAAPRLAGRCARGSVEALPFADETFDVTLAVTVLEFVADPAAALTEMARVTRRDGRIVVCALNPRSPWGYANRLRLRSGEWCAASFLDRRTLRALAAAHGRAELPPTFLIRSSNRAVVHRSPRVSALPVRAR